MLSVGRICDCGSPHDEIAAKRDGSGWEQRSFQAAEHRVNAGNADGAAGLAHGREWHGKQAGILDIVEAGEHDVVRHAAFLLAEGLKQLCCSEVV